MRALALLLTIALMAPLSSADAAQSITVTNSNGSSISIAKKVFTKTSSILVTGKGFDETVGIYLAYCVLPKKGAAPTPCGGGVNKAGIGDASYWISSNPPPYGEGLAIAYTPGGRFAEKVQVSRMIGKNDCKKVKCAISVRSDHLHEGDRTHDIFIPITFK